MNDTEIIYNQRGGFLGDLLSLIGRLMIATMFIGTGLITTLNFKEFADTITKLGFPVVVAGLVVGAKILGGLLITGITSIPFGIAIGKIMLLIFTAGTIAVTPNPFKDVGQLSNILKNIAIMGGLLLI